MAISYEARVNIIQTLKREKISWYGRLDDVEFLSRIYDLDNMPSTDGRFKTARFDIWQHTINNPGDWPDDWVYGDNRFNLYKCSDDKFLRFLCEMIHPVVRPDREESLKLLELFNMELRPEGYEISENESVFGNVRYDASGIVPSTIDALSQLKDLADTLDSGYLQRQIVRMLSAVKDDPELAIGTAKEFVESICKTILNKRGVQLNGKENIPKLVSMTRDEIKPANELIIDRKTERSVKKTLGSLANTVQGIAELRNIHGTGHGKDATKIEIDPMYASLAVNAAATIALFFIQTHEKSDIERFFNSISDDVVEG